MDYNQEVEYSKKSMTELVKIREEFEQAVIKYPVGTFNEHLQWLKMKIAERIGKK